jgi:ribonuclease P protein subunit POP4
MPSYDDVIKGEYIGKNVEVSYNNICNDNHIEGLIIDETKNTFKIRTQKGIKTFLKRNITLTDKHGVESYKVEGKVLIGKPEERLKKKKRRM